LKSENLNLLEPSGPVTGLYKDCFTFTFTVYKKREIGKSKRKCRKECGKEKNIGKNEGESRKYEMYIELSEE
jgi:hypothetical protein